MNPLLQIPPTPTPFPTIPPSESPIQLAPISLWDFAIDAVQTWNMIPDGMVNIIQAVILIFLIIFGIGLVIGFIRSLTSGGAESSGGEAVEDEA